MICPKCGEDNANNFRFCGMCGTTLLEARRPASTPAPAQPSAIAPKIANGREPLRPVVVEDAPRPSDRDRPVPPISGPSMLGLNQPSTQPLGSYRDTSLPSGSSPSGSSQLSMSQPSMNQPSMDLLRERSFSGLNSFLEQEEPKTGARRIVMLVVLLVALGAAGWWTYTNYLGVFERAKSGPVASGNGDAPAVAPMASVKASPQNTTQNAPQNAAPTSTANSSQAALPAAVSEGPSENASAPADTGKTAESETQPAAKARSLAPAASTTTSATHKNPPAEMPPPKRERIVASSSASKMAAPEPADTGDVAFRRGEAYLYGRGMPQNCDEAVKNLKTASAQSNARARSTFGTMYATGHCVPRDLPTSYVWFALALRVDPNNQILEKDLSAIWNQMTPPERQLATKMKQ